MRLFKLITGALVLLIIGLFVHQNLSVLKSPVTFSMDLFIREKISGEFSLYSLLFLSGIAGFLVGILLMLKPYFKTRRVLAQERQNKQTAQAIENVPAPNQESSTKPAQDSSGH